MHGYAIIGCVLNCRSLVFSYLWLNISNFLSDMRHKSNDTIKDQNILPLGDLRPSASKNRRCKLVSR